MGKGWITALTRWTNAGLIDEATAARIRAFEHAQAGSTRLRWPVWLALPFGGLMLGAGVLLFVSAHWDNLSPQVQFALAALLVAVFHLAAATLSGRFPAMASTLHAVGTVALGAGIYLAGQIFNLDEHWPAGLMLWALGAALGWALLRDEPQLALVAVLAPAWLTSEWIVATGLPGVVHHTGARVATTGVFLLALTYFTAVRDGHESVWRRILFWLGGISLLPAALALELTSGSFGVTGSELPFGLRVIGWCSAIGVPLVLAVMLRRRAAWANFLAAVWVLVLIQFLPLTGDVPVYAWWALGAAGLVAWGVADGRNERINMGSVMFALTVVAFYFSQVMDKLGRSASLIGFGLLFLLGGWALERVRRRLVVHARGAQS